MSLVRMKSEGKLDLEKLLSIKKFHAPLISPTKKKLAFTWDKTGTFELYVQDLSSKSIEQITDGNFSKGILANFMWSADEKSILFGKDVEGNEKNNLYRVNLESKKVEQLTDTRDYPEYYNDVTKDGRWAIFQSTRAGQMNLFRINLDSKEVEQITAHERPAGGAIIHPEGKFVAYSTNESSNFNNSDIFQANIDGSQTEKILSLSENSRENVISWNEDGTKFIFGTDVKGISQVGIYELSTGEHELLGTPQDDEYGLAITNTGVLVARAHDGQRLPRFYSNSGEVMDFNFPKGVLFQPFGLPFAVLDDSTFICTFTGPKTPLCLLKFDIYGNYEFVIDIDLGGYSVDDLHDMEHIWYPSTDGKNVPALIMKPKNFNESKQYQGVVVVHGGPTAATTMVFNAVSQLRADRDLVQIMPNYRGSIGYGKEWRMANEMDLGGMDLEDWSASVNYLVEKCNVRKDEIAIMGGSYGGYATLISVTKKPELWKFGIAAVPISHWGNLYEKSMPHFKNYLHSLFGDPSNEEVRQRMNERSPLNYVDNVVAPIMLMHGQNDPRCPVTEFRNFIEGLKNNGKVEGKDFEYVEWKDEGHSGFGEIKSMLRQTPIMMDYMFKQFSS